MFTVFNLQWLRLKREPAIVVAFLVMTIVFVFFTVGSGGEQVITIQTFSEDLSDSQVEEWLARLNDTDEYVFEIGDRETIEEQIQMTRISFALELKEDNYRYLVGQESQFLMAVNQHVEKVYRTHLRIEEVNELFPDSEVIQREIIDLEVNTLVAAITRPEETGANVVTGMTLYFSMFTLFFGLMNIAEEKRSGTWDRLISSPLRKSQIYLGQLLHYFTLGHIQIGVCFFVFHQFFGYSFGNQYLAIAAIVGAFVFATVSLGMLVISIVRTPQQLQAVIPIVATAMAMLGGAFWPLEVVSNQILLTLAKVTPIYHGIEGLKGAILYNRGIQELLQPLSILLLMGVLFMGIGLNLMERKR